MEQPKKELYKKLNADGVYTKSYEEFESQFSSPEKQEKLYQKLNSDGKYTKSKEEFVGRFFSEPVKKKVGTEVSKPIAQNQKSDLEPKDGSSGTPPIKQFKGFSEKEIQEFKSPAVKKSEIPKLPESVKQQISTQKDYVVKPSKKQRGFGEEVLSKLATGSSQLGADIASIPELIYDIGAIPQNLIADIFDVPSLKASSEKFSETFDVKNKVKDFYKQQVSNLKQESELLDKKYQYDITDSFINGHYENGFRQLTNSFAESLPATASIMVGGAYTKAPKLLIASTMMFGAGKNEELKEQNPEMDNNTRVANALASGLAEGAFETIGSGSIGSSAKALIEREGKQKAFSIMKDGLQNFYKESLKKNPLTASVTGEGIEEWATQVTQNAIDVATGVKPEDYNVFTGGSDAFIAGAFGGSVFGAGLKGLDKIVSAKDNEKVKANLKASFALQEQLENPEISPIVKTEIEKKINTLVKENQDIVSSSVDKANGLDEKLKEKLAESVDKISEIKTKVDEIKSDLKTPDSVKEILLSELKNEYKTAVEAKNSIIEGKTSVVDVLPLKEQDKIKRQALKELTAELNPDGTKNITIDNAQILERANQLHKKQIETEQNEKQIDEKTTVEQEPETQPQAEEQEKGAEVVAEIPNSNQIKTLSELESENKTTLPKIPSGKIFKNEVSPLNQNQTKGVDEVINNSEENNLPTEEIDVNLIVPTQKTVNTNNLKKTSEITEETEINEPIILVKENGKYFVVDGHHRISNDILNGKSTIEAKVFDNETASRSNIKPNGNVQSRPEPMGEMGIEQKPTAEIAPKESVQSANDVKPTKGKTKITKEPTLEDISNFLNENFKPNEANDGTKAESVQESSALGKEQKPKKPSQRGKTPLDKRKIKDKETISALKAEVFDAYSLVQQYFIGGGRVLPSEIKKLFNSSSEAKVRIGYARTAENKGATIDGIANYLWEQYGENLGLTTEDFRDAVEQVISDFVSTKSMAVDLNKRNGLSFEENNFNDEEFYEQAKAIGLVNENDHKEALSYLDVLTDEELIQLADKQTSFEEFLANEKNKQNISSKQQRKEKVNAEVDKIAQAVKDLLPGIKDPDLKKQGFSQDQLIDLVANAVKNLISAGIEIDEAIRQVTSSIKDRFGIDVNVDDVKAKLEPKAEEKPTIEQDETFFEEVSKETTTENKSVEFNKMASNFPNTGEVGTYLSGETIEKYTNETPENNQEIFRIKLVDSLKHGINTIQLAIDKFGDNFVEKVLEFTENNNIPLESKALLYISLENELNRQKIAFPENKSLLQKQLNLVRIKRQAFARSNSLALNMNRLQKFAEIGFDVNEITDKMFSPSEKESRKKVEKAIESNIDDINKQQEVKELGEEKVFTEKELEEEIKKAKKEWEESNLGFEIRQSKKQIKKEEALAQIQKIKDKWRKSVNDGTLSVSVPYAKQLAYVTPDIVQLAKVYSQIAGLTTIDIFNAVKQDILEVFKDIKDADIKSILKKEFGVKSKFASEESKRKAYISLLNRRIESLDEQISAGKRKIVERTDKYKNDSEINNLREIRNEKVKELAEIDPLYDERLKLKKSLESTEKQIKEYERKIEENDFTTTEKKEVDERLSELRNIRDKKKKDYQIAKKAFEQSLISEEEKSEIEYNQKINKKINSLNNRIEYLKNNKPEKNKEGAYSVWNQEISKLQNEKKELLNKKTKNKQTSNKELNALKNNIKNTKKAIFDLENNVEKNNIGKSSVFNSELSELKTKLSLLRQKAKEIKSNKNSILGQKNKETKISTLVKQALINKGYFREVNKKQPDGSTEVVKLLDWKKLAGEEGSIENIKNKAESALKEMGYTESQIESMQKALVEEYNDLRANIIEKSLKELESRNKIKPSVNRKTISKRLAELYNYGLFEENSDTYSNLLNSAIGFNEFQDAQYKKLKEYAKALSILFNFNNTMLKDKKLSEISIKTQSNIINNEIKNILSVSAFMEGNKMYKFVSVLRDFAGLSQRSKLLSLKQFLENPFSGFVERMFQKTGEFFIQKEDGKLVANRKKLAKLIYTDITLNGGMFYGEVTSSLTSQTKVEDWLNKQSDNKLYHLFLTNMTGRSYLEAADSMNKALITEKIFHQNIVKLLTNKNNPLGRMTKQEAMNYVAESLTGQNFEDAKKLAEEAIDKVNSEAGKKILPKTDNNILRFANDIVKESLLQGNKLDIDMVEKAYNSAYKSAGLTIGHEANNVISKGAGIMNARVEVALEKAIKEKKWNEATILTLESILTKNIINPFVGGGFNWLVLTLQKAGIDPISLISDFAKYRNNKIDLTTEEGIKNLENALYRSTNLRYTATRTLTGAIVSIAMASAFISSGLGDDLEDWLKQNEWARKYFKIFSPTVITLIMAYENGELVKELKDLLNIKSDNFNETLSVLKSIDSKNKSLSGELGRTSGKYFDTPIPWRLVKDIDNIKRGLNGLPEYKSNYQVNGFLNGVYQGGFIEYLGQRPDNFIEPKESQKISFPKMPSLPKMPKRN